MYKFLKNKLFSFLIVSLLFSCGFKEKIHKRTTISMGTIVEIQVVTNDVTLADKAIDSAFAEVQRINDKYTVYNKNSYLNQINSSDTFQLDEETYFLFKKCEYYHNLTKGAFDPAIGNVIKALGFEDSPGQEIPVDSIRNFIQHNNWKLIQLTDDRKIVKPKEVRINFGAIAKGYAVDRMFDILKSFGLKVFLVNAGGEIKCTGKIWEIGIQHPRDKAKIIGILKIKDLSVATSGDYERYKIKNGKRINHIINPITGKISDECRSVTIITENTIDADALATAVFVLGPKDGLYLLEKIPNCEAFIIDSSGSIFKTKGIDKFYVAN